MRKHGYHAVLHPLPHESIRNVLLLRASHYSILCSMILCYLGYHVLVHALSCQETAYADPHAIVLR